MSIDIDDQKRSAETLGKDEEFAEELLAGENRLLKLVAGGHSLPETLDALCHLVETMASDCFCSIVLVDSSGTRLQEAIAPSLPSAFNDAVRNWPVDRRGGPCAMAAAQKSQVIMSDVVSDTRWRNSWRELAQAHGLRSCWSTPILDTTGKVLGTFAMYYGEPRTPTPLDQGLIEQFTHIAGIAIERAQSEAALRRSKAVLADAQRELILTLDSIPAITWRGGANGYVQYLNKRWFDYTGTTPEQARGARWKSWVHPDDLDRLVDIGRAYVASGEPIDGEARLRRFDGEYRWFLFRPAPARDETGEVIAWYGTITDIEDRKGAEEKAREAERELQQTIDTIPIAVTRHSIEGKREFVNAAWKRFTGHSDELARSADWAVTTHPDDFPESERKWREALATGKPLHLEARFRRADGQYRWHAVDRVGFRDEKGNIAKWYSVSYDIEDRKRAETALRESEGRFRDYAETASDWLWEMGPDHKLTGLTGNAFRSSPSARLGTAAWERALDLETEPEKWRAIRATMDSHKPFRDFVYLAAGFDGSPPMYVKASGKPVFDSNGEFCGYRGTGTDVTAIIRTQEALRESERNLRSAIDGIPGLVAILAPNGDVEGINRQIVEYCGRSLEELKNWGTNGTIHAEDLPHLADVFTRSIASGVPYEVEARLRRFDGEYRWFDVRGIPVRDTSERITRWYVLLTDIEDRTQALARLQQMQSDFAHMNRVSIMGELAASLSHEITQPIASARNNARAAINFLDKNPPDLDEVREALDCVVGDADRAGNIIGRIRDQIRKAPPRKDYFVLDAAISEVIALARSAIVRNGISVQTRLAEGLPPVHGDRVQLQQVVLNLILNAVDAMGSVDAGARELLISAEQSHTGILIAVRDSGPGIDPALLERVFEAFYTTKSSGTGLGLSICRSIIHAHGGRLWADANEPRGAIFQFTLPGAEERS